MLDQGNINRVQNESQKQKKRQKRTHMTGEELKRIRKEMKFEPRDMYRTLNLPRRTYQDYEAGKRGIPAQLAARIREMHTRDWEWTAGIGDRVDKHEEGK